MGGEGEERGRRGMGKERNGGGEGERDGGGEGWGRSEKVKNLANNLDRRREVV